jgi:YaiO family outer membrane protein
MTRATRFSQIHSVLALVSLLGINAAAAQNSTVQLTFGTLDVDGGLDDRDYASLFLRQAVGPTTDLLMELATQSREENATFLSVGAALDLGAGSTLSFTLGGSDSDLGIYPEWSATAGYEYQAPATTGMVYRGRLVYADYAQGTESATLGAEAVRYFPANAAGGFFVGQLGGDFVSSEPGSETGWVANAAITYVQPSAWSIGMAVSTGTISYEPFMGAPVNNDFMAVRPFFAWEAIEGTEVLLRAEYVPTESFDLSGLSLGFKVDF